MAKDKLDKIHSNPEKSQIRNNPRIFSKMKVSFGNKIET